MRGIRAFIIIIVLVFAVYLVQLVAGAIFTPLNSVILGDPAVVAQGMNESIGRSQKTGVSLGPLLLVGGVILWGFATMLFREGFGGRY